MADAPKDRDVIATAAQVDNPSYQDNVKVRRDPDGSMWIVDAQGRKVMSGVPADQKALGITMNSSGGVAQGSQGVVIPVSSVPALRTASRDRLAGVLPWCLPVHRSVLDPLRHVGMSPVTSGVATLSHNATAPELPGMSFGLAFSAAGTAAVSVQLPSAINTAVPSPVLVGPRIHARIKCSDWSKVSGFWIDFLTEGGTTKKYRWPFYTSGRSLYGQNDPVYADKWNNKFRTFISDSENVSASGSPTATWGRATKYLECTGVMFAAVTTAAVTFEITRIYCPEWPIGAFVGIFDGWYRTAREFALREFFPRGWGCGGSVVRLDGDGEHPTPADIGPLIAANFDVFMHGHDVSGGLPTPMSASVTQASMLSNHSAHRRALAAFSPHAARGLRWHQWLQNLGNYSGTDLAGELKKLGVNAGRGFCIDGEWGVNPHNATTTLSDERRWQGWANLRGRFNRMPLAFYSGMSSGAGYYDETNTGDATYPVLRDRVEWAAKNAEPVLAYTHRITDVASSVDTTIPFSRDLVADLEAKERAGSLLMLSPTDLEYLTYWRPGDVFMRWDNEWVYRDDPTCIAF